MRVVRLPLGLVSDTVWILKGIDLDIGEEEKVRILAVFIEK